MIVPNFVRQWYEEFAAPAKAVQDVVHDLVVPFCSNKRYAFSDRVKDLESVAEKLESGRYASLDDLDDLYAATIVVPTLKDDGPVVDELERLFSRVEVRGRTRNRKDPEVFRFDSTRFYGRLKPSAAERDPRIDRLRFEIQVQTAFEHAWVAVTHDAVYKGGVVDWRRQRLAASLKAAVEQIDLMVVGFDNVVTEIALHDWEASELRQSVLEVFSDLITRNIDELLAPKSWVRFSNNFVALCEAEAKTRGAKNKAVVKQAVDTVKGHVGQASWRSPKSVSLFQLVLGILVTEGVITMKPGQYGAVVSDDLIALFPRVGVWQEPAA